MVQKLIQPVIRHIRSPITARSILLFILIGVIAITLIQNYVHERQSEERHRETIQNYFEAYNSRVEVKQQNEMTNKALDRLGDYIANFGKVVETLENLTQNVKLDREIREKQHTAIVRAVKPRRRVNTSANANTLPCYERRERVHKMGAAEVRVYDLIWTGKCQ